MSRMSRIKRRIQEHRKQHEEYHQEKLRWIRDYRAQWEANCRQGWDPNYSSWMNPSDPKRHYSPKPMRHWFFMKIFMVLFWACAAFFLIQFFTGNTFSTQKIPQYLGAAFVIMLVAFLMLRKMFGPLRYLMKGVK